MSMFDHLDDLGDYTVRDLLREVDDLIDEKHELEDKVEDLEAQVLAIQLLRNGDVHLIEYIWKVLSDSGVDDSVKVEKIRQETEKWWYAVSPYDCGS